MNQQPLFIAPHKPHDPLLNPAPRSRGKPKVTWRLLDACPKCTAAPFVRHHRNSYCRVCFRRILPILAGKSDFPLTLEQAL